MVSGVVVVVRRSQYSSTSSGSKTMAGAPFARPES